MPEGAIRERAMNDDAENNYYALGLFDPLTVQDLLNRFAHAGVRFQISPTTAPLPEGIIYRRRRNDMIQIFVHPGYTIRSLRSWRSGPNRPSKSAGFGDRRPIS